MLVHYRRMAEYIIDFQAMEYHENFKIHKLDPYKMIQRNTHKVLWPVTKDTKKLYNVIQYL